MKLRPASPSDAAALATFARDAFSAAFGHLYRPEDLASFFAEHRSEQKYRAQIADPDVRVMLAEERGEILAYALVAMGVGFEERGEPLPERPLFLSQLYCAETQTGRGLGAARPPTVLRSRRPSRARRSARSEQTQYRMMVVVVRSVISVSVGVGSVVSVVGRVTGTVTVDRAYLAHAEGALSLPAPSTAVTRQRSLVERMRCGNSLPAMSSANTVDTYAPAFSLNDSTSTR